MSQRFTGSSVSAASINFAMASAHTVCGWVYVANDGGADVCYLDSTGGFGGDRIWLGFEPSVFQFQQQLGGGGGYAFSTAVTTSAWVHIALTYDGTNSRSYINGALVDGPTAASLGAASSMIHLDIGFGGDFTVQGVMVFASALTQAQIQSAMQLTPPVSAYAWYRLDQAAPTTDSSGNSHTLSGAGDADGAQLLVAGTGATVTAATGTLSIGGGGTPVALTSTASATVTGASGQLSVAAPLATTASATVTGASAVLTTQAPLISSASATVTGASGILATSAPMSSIASATVTSMFGVLSGGVTPPSGASMQSYGTRRRFSTFGRRAAR